MRQLRAKVEGAYYHVTSRCAFQTFAFEAASKEMFVRIMRRAEEFSGVRVADYCVMDNHFHILVKVPGREEVDDAELDRRVAVLYGEVKANAIFRRWKDLADAEGGDAVVRRERDLLRARMYDISGFMKTLKQRFSLWYTTHHGNLEGSIWQGRFHSTLVENSACALSAVSAYIDRNPVRAGIVEDAKDYAWSGYGAACRGETNARAGILSIFVEGAKTGCATDQKWKKKTWALYREIVSPKRNEGALACNNGTGSPEVAVTKGQTLHEYRVGRLSRGLVFGSPQYVQGMIGRFRDAGTTRTLAVPCGKWRGGALCCAGRSEGKATGNRRDEREGVAWTAEPRTSLPYHASACIGKTNHDRQIDQTLTTNRHDMAGLTRRGASGKMNRTIP